jgi:hypothetical protein
LNFPIPLHPKLTDKFKENGLYKKDNLLILLEFASGTPPIFSRCERDDAYKRY